MACIGWSLWIRIKLKAHEGKNIEPCEAFKSILSMLRNFQGNCLLNNPLQQEGTKWEPPPIGSVKLNVDGVLFLDIQKVGIGFICLDHVGKVVLATSIVVGNVGEPETIEALAIFRSLQHCVPQRITHLMLESDCYLLVEELLIS